MAMMDHSSKIGFTSVVPSKGVNPYVVLRTSTDVAMLGYPKVILKSDGEPAIMTLKEAVRAEAAAVIEVVGKKRESEKAQIISEQPAAYVSKANGNREMHPGNAGPNQDAKRCIGSKTE